MTYSLEGIMFSQKLESLLMVSLEATRNERETFDDLSAGVDSENDTWDFGISIVV